MEFSGLFGSEYSRYPDLLAESLYGMGGEYRSTVTLDTAPAAQRAYLRVFGIPEVGLRIRAAYFARALKRLSSQVTQALDAGSGIGVYAVMLARRFPNARIVACDVDPQKIALTRTLTSELGLKNIESVNDDVTHLQQESNRFDLAVCIDVLEHVSDFRAALREIHRLLLPGGTLYIHTPQTNQKRLFKRFADWKHADHIREGFLPEELIRDLNDIGFVDTEVRQTFGFFGKLAWELNHATLRKNLGLAAIAFPALLAIGRLDPIMKVNGGLGLAVITRKARS
jgi:SAM-dependent methyltransferase